MTYKLNPAIEKKESPVVLAFPSGERQRYQNGAAVVKDVFDHKYLLEAFRAVEDTVEIILTEPEMNSSTWIGEEQMSFF